MSERTDQDNESDQKQEDEVLRRLLNTKPKPHKAVARGKRTPPGKR